MTWVVVGVLAALALLVLLGYNRLVRLRNRTEAAWADLDVQLVRRRSLIPDLVTTVGAYADHERQLFEAVTSARLEADRPHGRGEQAAAEARLDASLRPLLAVAEAYPDLRADARFQALHDELVATENKIAFSRQLYNDTVTAFRNAVESFPGTIYAGVAGFEPPERFALREDQRDRVGL